MQDAAAVLSSAGLLYLSYTGTSKMIINNRLLEKY